MKWHHCQIYQNHDSLSLDFFFRFSITKSIFKSEILIQKFDIKGVRTRGAAGAELLWFGQDV